MFTGLISVIAEIQKLEQGIISVSFSGKRPSEGCLLLNGALAKIINTDEASLNQLNLQLLEPELFHNYTLGQRVNLEFAQSANTQSQTSLPLYLKGNGLFKGSVQIKEQQQDSLYLTIHLVEMPSVKPDYLAINGVMLSVQHWLKDGFTVLVVPYTLEHTALNDLSSQDTVFLEFCEIKAQAEKTFSSIDEALEALRKGEMIIVVDDEKRENEGDLIMLADKVTPEAINFMITHARGLVCLALAKSECERLGLPLMTSDNRSKFSTAFTLSIEAAEGVGTGISAYDRAHTIKTAIQPGSTPQDITVPGHVFPVQACEGGVFVRQGHTEAAVDLAYLVQSRPGGVMCEILNKEGDSARLPELQAFAKEHNLKIIHIEDLLQYRKQHDCWVEKLAECHLPTEKTDFRLTIFKNRLDGTEHQVLVKNYDPTKPVYVRIHSSCFTGDVLHSQRCDCGVQLDAAMQTIAKQGGVLIYLQQEGRGIGLANKIKAYGLQEQGYDTVSANEHLGFPPDSRDFAVAAQILKDLGIHSVRLLTNNPRKISTLQQQGIHVVTREPICSIPNSHNQSYLATKRDKLGHLL